VASRPSDLWRRRVEEEEAAEVARGVLPPDETAVARFWPESLLASTDAALATFEDELRALSSASDADVLGAVKRVMLALNEVNAQQGRAGLVGYETDEREELCDYIDASVQESLIDVDALAARQGHGRWEIGDRWRDW
jgi:hypothetical protein